MTYRVALAVSVLVVALAVPALAQPVTYAPELGYGSMVGAITSETAVQIGGRFADGQTGTMTGVLTPLPYHIIAVTIGDDAWEFVTVPTTAAMFNGRHVALDTLNGRCVTVHWIVASDELIAALVEAR